MSNASEVEVVEETPAPSSRASTSAIPKRKARPNTVSAQASLEPQPVPSGKKSKKSPNGTGNSSIRVDHAKLEELQAENEALKREAESATEMASKFQEDFNKLQNLRFTKPETELAKSLAEWEDRERLLNEQNQALQAEIPRLREFLKPGAMTILTREETDQRLSAHRKDIQDLKQTVDEQQKTIDELKQALASSQLQLKEEVKRSSKLNDQLARQQSTAQPVLGDDEEIKRQVIISFYERLTNFKVHSVKKLATDEFGEVTELKCDCTTFGHSLFFKLEFYRSPSPEEPKLLDTVRFTPIGLDREKDEAYLSGLGYLQDTFTFVRDGGPFDKQMWELGVAVNKLMRAWREGGEEEEEAAEEDSDDDEDIEVLSAGNDTTTS
ncbi:Csm1 domain protein [Ceratobasidium sp. AG-Ba]|nr:Csm1 domain protein [Ceratobasidium sp. AG-Ba]QRW14427.1 Csm1 domain protein [Ceratobasidium sp. AG-Ba]